MLKKNHHTSAFGKSTNQSISQSVSPRLLGVNSI